MLHLQNGFRLECVSGYSWPAYGQLLSSHGRTIGRSDVLPFADGKTKCANNSVILQELLFPALKLRFCLVTEIEIKVADLLSAPGDMLANTLMKLIELFAHSRCVFAIVNHCNSHFTGSDIAVRNERRKGGRAEPENPCISREWDRKCHIGSFHITGASFVPQHTARIATHVNVRFPVFSNLNVLAIEDYGINLVLFS